MSTLPADLATWGLRNAHDPTVVRGEDSLWYMFSTDAAADMSDVLAGVHVRTSTDLVHWSFAGTALPGIPTAARDWSGAVGLWAPEVVEWPSAPAERRWHMYYSASSFGSRTSAIGLATAARPAGPWKDQGIVVATRHDEDAHNAIDAAVCFDDVGRPWLVYGSFFGGIHVVELCAQSGMRLRDERGVLIARRSPEVDGAVEGAYVVRREDGRFVLFVSYDSLVDSYSVRVGVADRITGPYLDLHGRDLADPDAAFARRIGTKILGAHRLPGAPALIAPGHNSIFRDGGATFTVHHVRFADEAGRHDAQIRRVHWTASGWPVVSPQVFSGYDRERLPAPQSAAGVWELVRLDPDQADVAEARRVEVRTETVSAGEAVTTSVLAITENDTTGTVLDAVVFGAWDSLDEQAVLALGGIAPDGVVWFGCQVSS